MKGDEELSGYIKGKVMSFLQKMIFILLFIMVCLPVLSSDKSYYETLAVSPTASQEEITQAYNRLMSQPGHHTTMTEIYLAYIVLKDESSRKIYDKQLQIKGANVGSFISDIQETKNHWNEQSKKEFDNAYAVAVGKSYPPTRAINLHFIAVAGFELSDEQVFSILEIVTRVKKEPRFVRRAALTVLSRYVNQLTIEGINVLILLSSSKNKIDDRQISKNKDKENSVEEKLSIKQMARDIADQWLKIQFEYSDRIDRIIEVFVNTDNKYASNAYKSFRKFVLQALEDRYAEKLTLEHIRLLQNFSRREIRHFLKIRNIVKKWNQLGNACPQQIKKLK